MNSYVNCGGGNGKQKDKKADFVWENKFAHFITHGPLDHYWTFNDILVGLTLQ